MSVIDLNDPFAGLDENTDATEIKNREEQIATLYMKSLVNKALTGGSTCMPVRTDLAAEMPNSLIPQYGGKVSLWAERVENILKSRGYSDLKNPDLTRDFLPIIINRVPQDVARDIPTTTLGDALDYLNE